MEKRNLNEIPIEKRMEISEKANKLMKEGKELLRGTLCRCKPDYLSACTSFKEAWELFAHLEDFDSAMFCLEKLALCNEKLNDLFECAEAHKNYGLICLQKLEDVSKARMHFKEAFEMYRLEGKIAQAQYAHIEITKVCIELNQCGFVDEFYEQIITTALDPDSDLYLESVDSFNLFIDYLLQRNKYTDALKVYERHMEYLCRLKKYENTLSRCLFCVVGIYIVMKEPFVAERKISEWTEKAGDLLKGEYLRCAQEILAACKDGNEEEYKRVVRKPILTQIELHLLKKLRAIKFEEEQEPDSPPPFLPPIEEEKGISPDPDISNYSQDHPIAPPPEDPMAQLPAPPGVENNNNLDNDENRFGGIFT